MKTIFIYKIILVSCLLSLVFLHRAEAATNISSSTKDHWAWNDIIGWMDFYNTDTVMVSSADIDGYASSSAGDISLNCETTRGGDICGQSNFRVTNNGAGTLAGWAWNDQYGWISFNCSNNNGCGQSNYFVRINPSTGYFSDYAWNDVVGWISFNCINPDICASSDYRVVTSWTATSTSGYLDSTTFDTGVASGTQINSVIWYGDQPSGTSVGFQFAVSNSTSGPWNFGGSDGTINSYYMTDPAVSKRVSYTRHRGYRYFRYRATLWSNQAQTQTPRTDDIFINWSP